MTKKPYINRNVNCKVTARKRNQTFDYTTIANRLRTVSWSNNSYPTGVVNRLTGPTLRITCHKDKSSEDIFENTG